MSLDVSCPNCGTQSYFDELTRDAEAFCRKCDYPLFWAQASRGVSDEDLTQSFGLRRLPGAGGREAIATIACPQCAERNALARRICIRCGADLHPVPKVRAPEPELVVEPDPEPEPEPEPEEPEEPQERVVIPLIIGAVGTMLLLIVGIVILAH